MDSTWVSETVAGFDRRVSAPEVDRNYYWATPLLSWPHLTCNLPGRGVRITYCVHSNWAMLPDNASQAL